MQSYDFELTSGLLALYNIMHICEDIPYSYKYIVKGLFVFVYFSFVFLCSNIFSESDQLVYGKYIFVNDILTRTFSRYNYLVLSYFEAQLSFFIYVSSQRVTYIYVENNFLLKHGFCRFLLHLVAVGVDLKPTQQYREPWKYGDLFQHLSLRLG